MAGRILVIRGGAIGDFILTLPSLALLRDAFPETHIEVLGYPHIAALADGRRYANAVRSIESGRLAGFFNPKADLDPELCEYFASFHQVISWLFDPDGFFEGNLRRAGVRNLICGTPKIGDHAHAAAQLAEPLSNLALFSETNAAIFHPSQSDLDAARQFLPADGPAPIALHPGSGGERKNWPLDRWLDLVRSVAQRGRPVLVIGGESDLERISAVRSAVAGLGNVHFLEHLPLPVLGAVFAGCRLFIGHDSGISHLAAAAGAPCILLFGPTDPAVWAPANPDVHVVRAESGSMADIPLESVRTMVDSLLPDV
jgi:ADP-heptose:LPS heptosyltransferase